MNDQTALVAARITADMDIMGGRPCIRGLRMRVSDILELYANGATDAEILDDYPFLEVDDLRAALAFAALSAHHPVLAAE